MKDEEGLKTLKDLEDDPTKETSYLTIKNIKAEAIKWVKEYLKRYDEESQDVYADDFIKHFFNLTEEDLE
jgi:hypothetical protein